MHPGAMCQSEVEVEAVVVAVTKQIQMVVPVEEVANDSPSDVDC